ncbi:MAG: hypothetical protein VCA36_04805, partial [Opitutales bacterium]
MDSKEQEQKQEPISRKRKIGRILLVLAALLVFVSLSWMVWDNLRQNVWAYYTDDAGTEVGVEENKARYVLWEDPAPNNFGAPEKGPPDPDKVDLDNQGGTRLEATFSPNGATMILVRQDNNVTGADMFVVRWNGRIWSRPEAVTTLNSISNDRGPAFSPDGEHLYFASDREGGQGGYDLYVARKDGEGWGAAEPLGDEVNTEKNELGPAPSADGKRLFFSSDRNESTDIFVANSIEEAVDPDEPGEKLPSPMPRFSAAEPVGDLNSEAEDVQAALTSRGDHVFLASDRERDDESGFSLYLSRVVGGKELAPEKIDLYFEKGEATDPAIRMEGFDLLFSRTLEAEDISEEQKPEDYRLYRSTTR